MPALGSLIVRLGMDIAEYTQGWDKADQKTLEVGKRIQSTLDGVQRTAASFAGGVAAGIVAGFSVSAFKGVISGVIDTGAALDDLRMQTGATVEALSGLAAVGKFNNMSAEDIGGAMNMLAKNMAGATEESRGASKALEALGIDFGRFKQLRPEEQMHEVAKAMADFEDGTGKSAVAMALYGKQGAQMLPFLHDLAEVSELAAKMTTEQAAAAADFDDNLTRLASSGDAWKKELAMGMLPALDQATKAFMDVMNGTGGLRDEVKRLSKDGSVAEWTRTVITGFSYVVDAGEIVIRVIRGLGTALGGAMASTVTGVGSIAQAWSQIKGGDAFGAWDTLKSGAAQVTTIIGATYSDLADMAKQPTMGANFRAAMAKQVADAQNAGAETRKALDFTNITGKSGNAGGSSAAAVDSDYDKLVKRIKERIDASRMEQEVGRTLTEQEKFGLKVVEDMANAKKALTQAERDRVLGMLKTSAAETEATEQQRVRLQSEKDLRTSENQRISAYEKTVQASADANKQLREEVEMIGLTERQQLAVTQARMADTIAQKEQALAGMQREGFMSREAIALEEEIRLLRERSTLLGAQFDRTEVQKAVQAQIGEWTKFTDSVYNGLTDSLFRGFEAGKDFFSSFWAGIKNTLKTSVLKFGIQAVLGMSGVTGLLGGAGVATAGGLGGSGGNGLQSLLSGASTAYQVAGLAGLGGSLGFGASTGLGMTMAGNTGAALSLGAANIAGVGGAGAAAGLGTIIGAAAPYLAAAALVANALGVFRSTKVTGTGISGSLGYQSSDLDSYVQTRKGGTLFSGPSYSTKTEDLDPAQAASIQATVKASYANFIQLGEALHLNTDAVTGYTKAIDISTKDLKPEEIQAKITAIFGELANELANRLSGGISENFGKVGETSAQTLTRLVTDLQAVNGALGSVGQGLLDMSMGGAVAASALVDGFGGIDAMRESSAAFLAEYFTAAQRADLTTRQLTAAFGQLGYALPESREQLKEWVFATDLTTEAGRAARVGLMGLAPALGTIRPATEDVAAAVQEMSESVVLSATDLRKARQSLEEELFQAQNAGNTGALRARELAGLDAQDPTGSLRRLKEAIWAVGDAAEATAAAEAARKTALQDAVSALGRSVAAQRSTLQQAFDGASAGYQRVIADQTAAVASLTGLSGRLRSTLDGMQLPGTEEQSRRAAQAYLDGALATARAGGVQDLDQERLAAALATAAKPGQDFESFAALEEDYAKTVNAMVELKGITDASLSFEQQTLDVAKGQLAALESQHAQDLARLDAIVAGGQALLDRMNGVNTSILSLADAILGVNKASAAAGGFGTVDPAAGFTLTEEGIAAFRKSADDSNAIGQAYLDILGRTADLAGLVYFEQQAMAGASMDAIRDAIRTSPEAIQRLDGSHEDGLAYVPRDGYVAELHRGERVLTADEARDYRATPVGGGQQAPTDDRTVAELKALREVLTEIRNGTLVVIRNTRDTAKAVDTINQVGVAMTPADTTPAVPA